MIIGIGTDICKIERINFRIANTILTDKELEIFNSLQLESRKREWLAGRFSAKEAIYKALDKKIPINKIEILYDEEKPVCNIEGYKVFISISHEKEYAIAYSIVESL